MRLETGFIVDGEKLTSLRIASGLSLEDVARRLKCNKGNISRWERGKVVPGTGFILAMVLLYKRFDFVKKSVGGGKDGN